MVLRSYQICWSMCICLQPPQDKATQCQTNHLRLSLEQFSSPSIIHSHRNTLLKKTSYPCPHQATDHAGKVQSIIILLLFLFLFIVCISSCLPLFHLLFCINPLPIPFAYNFICCSFLLLCIQRFSRSRSVRC